MNNLAFITYTHTKCEDLWTMYIDSLNKYCPIIKNYMLVNEEKKINNANILIYDDNKNYCQEYVRLLESIKEEYVIYMQEDFFLYDNVNIEKINRYLEILQNSRFSFIRLIKCGDVTEKNAVEDLFLVTDLNSSHKSINSFSMQPTIWKKSDLINLYNTTNTDRFGENWNFIQSLNNLKMHGLYCYNNENKRGVNHYDSSVFPYIATAIVKGKWNTLEYDSELESFFQKYKIDKSIRGENKF